MFNTTVCFGLSLIIYNHNHKEITYIFHISLKQLLLKLS